MRLKRKVALITGVGRGLGRGIALAFVREGHLAHYAAYMDPEAQEPQPTEPLTDGMAEAMAIIGAALDLATALKATQILSGASTLDRLLETMMAVVIEHTGAQRGVFLWEHDGGMLIVRRQDGACGRGTRLDPLRMNPDEEVSRGIIQYDAAHPIFLFRAYLVEISSQGLICRPRTKVLAA